MNRVYLGLYTDITDARTSQIAPVALKEFILANRAALLVEAAPAAVTASGHA